MKLYVECRQSKNDASKRYPALVLDLGYATKLLSFDVALLSELTELPVSVLRTLKVGDTVSVEVDNK